MLKKTFATLLFTLAPLVSLLAQTDSVGSGYALKFTGTDGSYVDLGDILNTLSFPFTIEAWINISGYQNVQGAVFSSDDSSIYSGFFLYERQGQFFMEFGDNINAGEHDRRGFETSATIPLHKWVHLAVVCNSVSSVQFYFNGVLQNSFPTDGSSGATSLLHNSGHAHIGNLKNISGESPFLGQIDEIRLWNTARTLTQIQQNMCSRVAPVSNLVGYWKGAGAIKGTGVTDYAAVPHNGEIIHEGVITKVVSGAPVGDYSSVHYGSFINKSIILADPSGDTFKIAAVSGNPLGVAVYGVNNAPFRTGKLLSFPSHYFGVFCIENTTPATFRVTYHYANASAVGQSESNARIFSKMTDSSTMWTNTGAKPDTADNTIIKSGLATRGEFILNFIASPMLLSQSAPALPEAISAFPNPAHNYVILSFSNLSEPVNSIRIVDLTGKVIHEVQNPSNTSLNLDINNWSSGLYFAEAMTAKGNYFTRFIIQ